MKNILFLFLLILVVIFLGCETTENYEACLNNPECNAEILQIQSGVTTTTATTLCQVPSTAPYALAVASILGGLTALFVGINKGKKIRKEK